MASKVEPLEAPPYISFFCSCGKKLYSISTNLISYWGDIQCPKCKRKYISRNGLIASPVIFFEKGGKISVSKSQTSHTRPSLSSKRT